MFMFINLKLGGIYILERKFQEKVTLLIKSPLLASFHLKIPTQNIQIFRSSLI